MNAKNKKECTVLEITIPWSADPGSSRYVTTAELSGYGGLLSILLAKIVTPRSIWQIETTMEVNPWKQMIIAQAISRCGRKIAAIGWRIFHKTFADQFSGQDPEQVRFSEAIFFFCHHAGDSVSIEKIARHLGWNPAKVCQWAEVSCERGLIECERSNKSGRVVSLKTVMDLGEFLDRFNEDSESDQSN